MLQGPLAQVSNRSTFELLVKILDAETNELIDLTGLTLVFALCPRGTFPYWWGDSGSTAILVASTIAGQAGNINIIDLGVAQVIFPASAMRVCAPADYDAGFTAKPVGDDTDICQIFVGGISIIEGVVTSP